MEELQRNGLAVGGQRFTFEFSGLGDMKLQLLLYGRGAASSTYPCLYCDVRLDELLASVTARVDNFDVPFERMTSVATMHSRYAERTERGYTATSDDCRWYNQQFPPLLPVEPHHCPIEKLHLKLRLVDKFDSIFEALRTAMKVSDGDYRLLLKRLHVFKGLPILPPRPALLRFVLSPAIAVRIHWLYGQRMHEASPEGGRAPALIEDGQAAGSIAAGRTAGP